MDDRSGVHVQVLNTHPEDCSELHGGIVKGRGLHSRQVIGIKDRTRLP